MENITAGVRGALTREQRGAVVGGKFISYSFPYTHTHTLTVDSSGDAGESLQGEDDKQSGYSRLLIT